jgi:hypothetical protein
MNGPPSTEFTDFPLSGFVHVMWKLDTVVTSRPSENTDSLNVPCEWTTIGNAQVSGLAAIVRVLFHGVIVTFGAEPVATGTSTRISAAVPARIRGRVKLIPPPLERALRQEL